MMFGECLFRQVIGIPMLTKGAPLFIKLFLYSYEREVLDRLVNPITYGGGAFWPGPSDYRPQL